jgi:hypothetical protein
MEQYQPTYSRRNMLLAMSGLGTSGTGMAALGVRSLINILGFPPTLLVYNGHTDFINSAAWSPDGTAQVWNASTRQTMLVYHRHQRPAQQAACPPSAMVCLWLSSLEVVRSISGSQTADGSSPHLVAQTIWANPWPGQ